MDWQARTRTTARPWQASVTRWGCSVITAPKPWKRSRTPQRDDGLPCPCTPTTPDAVHVIEGAVLVLEGPRSSSCDVVSLAWRVRSTLRSTDLVRGGTLALMVSAD